jgi:hypothetical protein
VRKDEPAHAVLVSLVWQRQLRREELNLVQGRRNGRLAGLVPITTTNKQTKKEKKKKKKKKKKNIINQKQPHKKKQPSRSQSVFFQFYYRFSELARREKQ